MYNKFIKALAWNSGAAFIYKIALLAHQIALYAIMPTALYGVQSSLFAVLYLAVACTNFGFDDMLLPFFSRLCQSRQQFKPLWLHSIAQIIIIFCCACLFFYMISYESKEFLHNISIYCNKNICFFLSFLFFIESLKRSLLAIMQLAFLNKQIAYAQIFMLYAYICTIWICYGWCGTISLTTIFVPMALYSTLEFCYLLKFFMQFYHGITQGDSAPSIPFKVLLFQRCSIYTNQIAKVIYNQNSMTLCFAYTLGFAQAATIKFFTNAITLFYTCIAKSVGVTTGATLSTSLQQVTLAKERSFFNNISYRYFQCLAIFSLITTIVVSYAYYNSIITQLMAWHIMLFFGIGFLEHAGIMYEQLLIVHSKGWVLASINIVSLFLVGLSWYGYRQNLVDGICMLLVFLIIKITTLCIIRCVAHKVTRAQE